jgi:Tol biopolymer transport system component
MGADGSGVRKLTSRGGNCRPDWSPDGRRIAYVSDAADRKGDIWTMDPDGGNPQRLTFDDTTYDYDPAWSPDGNWIVYHRTTDKQRGPWAIWAIPAVGGEPVRISPEGADDRFPDWAP